MCLNTDGYSPIVCEVAVWPSEVIREMMLFYELLCEPAKAEGIVSPHQRSHAAALHDRPVRPDAENLQGVCQTAGVLR